MIWNKLTEWIASMFDAISNWIIEQFNSIKVPDFVQSGIAYFYDAIPDELKYFLCVSGVPEALGILGAGAIFRLTRIIITRGKW